MGNHVAAVETDPQQLEQAYGFWQNFKSFMVAGVVGVTVLLSLMAIFLV
ncbi:MAG: aa3-type cytochrome c oxidase subunit IV [Micavibrio aeruginosavorus]|uniref:Aa3-type cytochrome c oxidase subunit IV n=1 Tax=Micavibrio aeruginosavorus TaxID=349221 RepID=A0A7T5R1X5_9BACT|nr:MAG: aa3-type cytochrome c oxidase subunit IV [Micavibrio aeruginosavorus]